jgi:hypothetical protein
MVYRFGPYCDVNSMFQSDTNFEVIMDGCQRTSEKMKFPCNDIKLNFTFHSVSLIPQDTMSSIASTTNFTNVDIQRTPKTKHWSHSPVVFAMLTGNQMKNCSDVFSLLSECAATSSEDRICKTASEYFYSCTNN